METTNDDNVTLRSRLEQIYNSSGRYDPRLDLPFIPRELEYLVGWFWEIRNAIGGSGFGANPISFSEIKAWCDLNDMELTPWEVFVIRRMDNEFLKISNKSSKDKMNAAKAKGR